MKLSVTYSYHLMTVNSCSISGVTCSNSVLNLQENKLLIAKLSITLPELCELQNIVGSAIPKQLYTQYMQLLSLKFLLIGNQFMLWLYVFALQSVQYSDLSLNSSTFI